jgi:type I restriction enzyme S subunit
LEYKRFQDLFAIPLRNGLTKPKSVRGMGTKIVNMGEMFGNSRLRNVPMDRVHLTPAERESSLLQVGDLLFARQSLVLAGAGKCAVFLEDEEEVCFESHIIRCRLDENLADPLYYFYLFQSNIGRQIIEAIVEQGAGASGIRGSDLAQIMVPYPSIKHQKECAALLNALDSKIEINRRIVKTQEEVIRAIFQAWFVDFDPVRSKITAKFEGRDIERAAISAISGKRENEIDRLPPDALLFLAEVSSLFPNSLIESELGEMPTGWTIASIEQLAEKVGMGPFGSNIKVSTFVSKGMPIISGQHLNDTLLDDKSFKFISNEQANRLANSIVTRGDVIFTHAGNIGQVSYIPDLSMYTHYILSQRQFYLRCNRSMVSPIFLVYFFRSREGQHQLLANANQVGVPSLARPVTYLKSIRIQLPPIKIIEVFDALARRLHHLISRKKQENKLLENLRDTLLNKLLTGDTTSITSLTEVINARS